MTWVVCVADVDGIGVFDVDGVVSRRSSIIVLRGGKVPTGVYCRRNLQLQMVILPELSTLMTY